MQQTLLEDNHKDGISLPDKGQLLQKFKGKALSDIQTPHLVIDEGELMLCAREYLLTKGWIHAAIFKRNCEKMKAAVDRLGWNFRAHIKTHKASEGVRLQCIATGPRIVCSTLPEM